MAAKWPPYFLIRKGQSLATVATSPETVPRDYQIAVQQTREGVLYGGRLILVV
jgi:hypothetical protein